MSILSVSLRASMGMQALIRMTSLTSRNRDFRLTPPWKISLSGVSSRARICSDPRNRHFENLFFSAEQVYISPLDTNYLIFNSDGTLKLRLQIRIDDFRKLQNTRNISNKARSEKLSFETLKFYTYTTRVCSYFLNFFIDF